MPISINLGRKNEKEAHNIFTCACIMISVSTALIFPVILIILLWPLGLTGIWLNFAGTSLLAGILAFIILYRQRGELMKDDIC